jgi:hypothetical protein
MKLPEYIYHYTTIENLALILKNKTIRFNSISYLDDLLEANSNIGHAFHFALVSCWTDQKEENIALWSMYCKNGKGVKIKMRPTLFHDDINIPSDRFYFIRDKELLYSPNFLYKIKYVDKPESIIRGTEIVNSTVKHNLTIGDLGREKKSIWSFQNEWRFIINQLPDKKTVDSIINPTQSESEIIKPECFKVDYYDLKIQNSEMKKMEITLGPSTNKSEQIIIEALVEIYNPNIKIKLSSLHDQIRL